MHGRLVNLPPKTRRWKGKKRLSRSTLQEGNLFNLRLTELPIFGNPYPAIRTLFYAALTL
ncbi:hypothetical protein M407DRAFT_100020 [Tulasnella calospora MUT 4182]|uniref:Uncharacterized protein n=1 Tax=Tulasnella calospora MUT 4182 TaxID=1051891 RepID=A0A0C3LSZ6_9AGAM|nr:hypothetical protein M407DRAFT_100020 [Tulasnella calospora MUT 4182]